MFEDQYYAAINNKLANKSKDTSVKVNINSLNKQLTNDLLKHYENTFNENYDIENKLTNEIMNKDQLISINQDSYEYKNLIVRLLTYFLFLLFFYIFIALGFTLKIYSTTTLLYIILIFTILYFGFVVYRIYYDPAFFRYRHKLSDDSSLLHKLSDILLPGFFHRKSCPKHCNPKVPRDEKNYPILDSQIREMQTDTTADIWDGKKKVCYWDGSMQDFNNQKINQINNMPYIFRTDIPCKYFPGYKQK